MFVMAVENELHYVESLRDLEQQVKESEGPKMRDEMWQARYQWWIEQKEKTGYADRLVLLRRCVGLRSICRASEQSTHYPWRLQPPGNSQRTLTISTTRLQWRLRRRNPRYDLPSMTEQRPSYHNLTRCFSTLCTRIGQVL